MKRGLVFFFFSFLLTAYDSPVKKERLVPGKRQFILFFWRIRPRCWNKNNFNWCIPCRQSLFARLLLTGRDVTRMDKKRKNLWKRREPRFVSFRSRPLFLSSIFVSWACVCRPNRLCAGYHLDKAETLLVRQPKLEIRKKMRTFFFIYFYFCQSQGKEEANTHLLAYGPL